MEDSKKAKKKRKPRGRIKYQAREGEKEVLCVKVPFGIKEKFTKIGLNSSPKCSMSQHVVEALERYIEDNAHMIE